VRLCNKHNSYSGPCVPDGPACSRGVIYLDLRRMNRIIEINEKNMYAVVEPYVISAQLQAELMKRGCTLTLKGPGQLLRHAPGQDISIRPPAATTGTTWPSSGSPRREIVRSGALGSTDEWFSGDGPGLP